MPYILIDKDFSAESRSLCKTDKIKKKKENDGYAKTTTSKIWSNQG